MAWNKESETLVNARLVEIVRANPILYDNREPHYNNREVLDECWSNIAQQMGLSVRCCRTKWGNLRTAFVRSLKFKTNKGTGKIKRRKPYYLSNALEFLLPYIRYPEYQESRFSKQKRKSISSADDDVEEDDLDSLDEKNFKIETLELNENADIEEYMDLFANNADESNVTNDKNDYIEEPNANPASSTKIVPVPANKVKLENTSLPSSVEQGNANFDSTNVVDITQHSSRLLFLLSLKSDVEQLSEYQMRVFKRKVLRMIDDIIDKVPAEKPALRFHNFRS